MSKSMRKQITSFVVILTFLFLTGCFFILVVNQPSNADEGETITVTMEVEMDETSYGIGGGPSAGITALMLPMDWTVVSVGFDGDYGPETMVYLPPDSIDIQPAAGTDYWRDSLATRYPPGAGMDWYVYEGVETHLSLGDTASHVTFTYELTTGAAGEFELGYFVSTADLGFADPTYFDVSLGNTITVSAVSALDDNPGLVKGFALEQNYPNPFNPGTKIQYQIAGRSNVNLTVYDITGKVVSVLVNSYKNAGKYQVDFNGYNLTSGIYIYRLTAGDFSETRKMSLIK